MDKFAALEEFIKTAIESPRAERFKALIANSKGQRKFLNELCHGIEDCVRDDVQKETGYSSFKERPCYVYSWNAGFGVPKDTVEAAYDLLSVDDSWLIVTQAGSFAVYRPESRWDAEIFIRLR